MSHAQHRVLRTGKRLAIIAEVTVMLLGLELLDTGLELVGQEVEP